MTRGQAVLASAAVILQLVGAPVSRADELADLRANNLLLEQKIDQARALNGEAPEKAPASLQGSFPRSFRIPGTETSVRVGGSVTATVHDSLER